MEFFGFTFIMFIGAAVTAAGLLMLILAAFTTSAAWGIASLVVPPAAIAFAITHFNKGKNGFAILMIGIIVFGYGSWDKQRNERDQQLVASHQQEQQVVEPAVVPTTPQIIESGKSEPVTKPSIVPPITRTDAAPDPGAPKYPIINMLDVGKYVGREIRVTTVNGAVRTGELLEAHKDSIVLKYQPKGVATVVEADIKEGEVHLIELLD